MPEMRFTLPGTKLPETLNLPPTLLFHRWQAYDRFKGNDKKLDAFSQNEAKLPFLRRVAEAVQREGASHYRAWHGRFSSSLGELRIEPVLRATTLWRLVVGWGTNPTFETGLTLDHLVGFPFIPGSAVKGLLHRVAEQELLAADGASAAVPPGPRERPAEPPPDLTAALVRARRVRALFGSLHLRRDQASDPEAPYDRLTAWLKLLPESDEVPEPWIETRRQLARLSSDAPAGGMVSCFDAVPDPAAFEAGERQVLTPDVLTPHESGPTPIPFLAVRDGVTFELRYRLVGWPAAEPRDSEERERASDLGGFEREAVSGMLQRWLVRGLTDLGLGGKTSAGYGYLLAEGARLVLPQLLAEPPLPAAPQEILPEPERLARLALPEDIDSSRAVAALDKALKEGDRAVQAAVAARFQELFPQELEKWRSSQRSATRKRVEAIDRLLGAGEELEP